MVAGSGGSSGAGGGCGGVVLAGVGCREILGTAIEGLGTAAEVSYVLLGGLLLYNVLVAGGGVERVS